MQLIEDLRHAAEQLEKEAPLIQELRAVVEQFVDYCPSGISTYLDEACARGSEVIVRINEMEGVATKPVEVTISKSADTHLTAHTLR